MRRNEGGRGRIVYVGMNLYPPSNFYLKNKMETKMENKMETRNQTLIIGEGEVGKALYEILKEKYRCYTVDVKDAETEAVEKVDFMHVCIPYSIQNSFLFIDEVKRYQNLYKPKFTVIHSTVPVGVSRLLNACHSPIRGMHPRLEESIRMFVKFVGGEGADEVADYFKQVGLKVQICRDSKTTELAKLLDTLYYGVCIEYAKEAEKLCRKYRVPFSEAYTLFNQSYNEGYVKLGYPEYQRPVLQPIQRKIGGQCVVPNLDLLRSKFSKFIKSLNK